MSYRVCIPVAGTGSRLGSLTHYLNKSLVSVANKPVLSHIIESFPEDSEFVLPLGYKGNLVREFLRLAYPGRRFHFSEVNPYEGPESGLGLSLLTCEKYLNEPFVFCSCDTLVDEQIPDPDNNWMGIAKVRNLSEYRTAKLDNNRVLQVFDKGMTGTDFYAYIGLAGIRDYRAFWEIMHEGAASAIQMGESYALQRMVESSCVDGHKFTWYDCGNPEALLKTREVHHKASDPNILEKPNEAIWFVSGNVIKFSDDVTFIKNRVARAAQLPGFVPKVVDHTEHMYRYEAVQGKVLSQTIDLPLFRELLAHAGSFWEPHVLSGEELKNFETRCLRFYKDKTEDRIAKFYRDFERQDNGHIINGFSMPTLEALCNAIDWSWLSQGLPTRFHGDFHPENILWSPSDKTFTYLDWRQDFAGDLVAGDIYYDFAKLLHGLIISHEIIARDLYSVEWKDNNITFDFNRKQMLVECESEFHQWLDAHHYDREKVRILTALIFLNIAALHHYPYCLLLFALGKSMLFHAIRGQASPDNTCDFAAFHQAIES